MDLVLDQVIGAINPFGGTTYLFLLSVETQLATSNERGMLEVKVLEKEITSVGL